MQTPAVQQGMNRREGGNVLVLSLLLVSLLTALATAFFAVTQKNSRHSSFVNNLGELRRYAETGINLALHELTYGVGNGDGYIGTELWTLTDDVGRDGKAGTSDEGEADGVPTPGEPNVKPTSVGPVRQRIGLLVHTSDTAWPDVKRVVSTAANPEAMAVSEVYARRRITKVPHAAAVYVQPGVPIVINGNKLWVSGDDTNPDRSSGPEPPVYGLATDTGDPPGSNADKLFSQLDKKAKDRITGLGGSASIGEIDLVDFEELISAFKDGDIKTIEPGTYGKGTWGVPVDGQYQVTVCDGDLGLSGRCSGAGVLIVEGSLTVAGDFDFEGVVFVRGDVVVTGGANKVHLYGSLMVGRSLTEEGSDVSVAGTSKILFCSAALAEASSLLKRGYKRLYWNDIK